MDSDGNKSTDHIRRHRSSQVVLMADGQIMQTPPLFFGGKNKAPVATTLRII